MLCKVPGEEGRKGGRGQVSVSCGLFCPTKRRGVRTNNANERERGMEEEKEEEETNAKCSTCVSKYGELSKRDRDHGILRLFFPWFLFLHV